jgi:hypothetical protein
MAESLTAFVDGDRGEVGHTGAMLLAEGLANLRVCSEFAQGYAKALSKRGRCG